MPYIEISTENKSLVNCQETDSIAYFTCEVSPILFKRLCKALDHWVQPQCLVHV